jgi:hypothetical protein
MEEGISLLLAKFQSRGLTRQALFSSEPLSTTTPARRAVNRTAGSARRRLAAKTPPMPQCVNVPRSLGRGQADAVDFMALTGRQVCTHYRQWWQVYADPRLQPADRSDADAALRGPSGLPLQAHTAIYLCYLGFKVGPWRQALLAACAEAGLDGTFSDAEPELNPALLLTILQNTAARMDGRSLGPWALNVGRSSLHHSGGICFLRLLGVACKAPAATGTALRVGAAGAPAQSLSASAPACAPTRQRTNGKGSSPKRKQASADKRRGTRPRANTPTREHARARARAHGQTRASSPRASAARAQAQSGAFAGLRPACSRK